MNAADLGRRRFIARALVGLALAATGSAPSACREGGDRDARVIDALRRLLGPEGSIDPSTAAGVPDRRAAIEQLVGALRPAELDEVLASPERLRRHLDEQRQADFEAGRLVYLDGWMLTESELAVAALSSDQRGGAH